MKNTSASAVSRFLGKHFPKGSFTATGHSKWTTPVFVTGSALNAIHKCLVDGGFVVSVNKSTLVVAGRK